MPDESRPAFVPLWRTCKVAEGCAGAAVRAGACLAHLGDHMHDYVRDLKPGDHIDARGVIVPDFLVEVLLTALRGEDGTPVVGTALFAHAEIIGPVWFDDVTFGGPVDFSHTRFTGHAQFDRARFEQGGLFDQATFLRPALFDRAEAVGTSMLGSRNEPGSAR